MRINRRERTFLGAGALVLALLAVYFLIVAPLSERRQKLEALTGRLEEDLAELRRLAAQYQTLARVKEELEKRVQGRGGRVAPFAFLESLARESGLTGRIESMTPVASPSGEEGRAALAEFDVRLSGIGLLELVRFLYRLESSDAVFFVVNLNIRPRYLNPELLDVSLRLASPKSA
ncbi:MAG: type II secretion system protein GspM [Thermodesulfobacteriota bacterium]